MNLEENFRNYIFYEHPLIFFQHLKPALSIVTPNFKIKLIMHACFKLSYRYNRRFHYNINIKFMVLITRINKFEKKPSKVIKFSIQVLLLF